ncbi:interleukin-9-like [Aphelocoma coerulescens]|uniref:interleukin-9-like n=1 Tax=Aphelocoma coerulescens TaxID=39617 RepID=UPI003604A238
MNASMLSYILLSCLLLSVQAEYCGVREIIRYTEHLLGNSPVSCPCRQAAVRSCSCLPIPESGHELACFVNGTKHLLENNESSNPVITRLYWTFQALLDRKLCKRMAHGDQCQYKTKGNVTEFLETILTTYQKINKSDA